MADVGLDSNARPPRWQPFDEACRRWMLPEWNIGGIGDDAASYLSARRDTAADSVLRLSDPARERKQARLAPAPHQALKPIFVFSHPNESGFPRNTRSDACAGQRPDPVLASLALRKRSNKPLVQMCDYLLLTW
jgi:hypothetical protein